MAFKNKRPPIDYSSRDFSSIRQSLVDHAKRYYPETFNDFDSAGFGSLMIDTVAYVGDILSFYLDYQANETFLETATEVDSLLKIGKQMGYKSPASGIATGLVDIYVEIPANSDGTPNLNYRPIVKRGSTFSSVDGGTFTLTEDVSFNDDNADILLSKVNDSTGVPTNYVMRKAGEVVSGKIDTQNVVFEDFVAFNKVEVGELLEGAEVVEVISVFDSENNQYFQVDSLAQDIVYRGFSNKDPNTNSLVPNILKPVVVPRRYTTSRTSDGRVTLQFGGGSETSNLDDQISDPSSVAIQQRGKNYISSTYFDPNILAYNNKLGIGPSNTTVEITFIYTDEQLSNAAAGAVTEVNFIDVEFEDEDLLDEQLVQNVRTTVEVENQNPIVGDVIGVGPDELRERIVGTFATQNRAVTREDYIYLSYLMPAIFGSVKRANAYRDPDSQKRNLNLYIISEDEEGKLTAPSSALKNNLRTWMSGYKMINDTIDILDAKIINLGINFSVLADEDTNKFDVLDLSIAKLQEDLAEKVFDIGENFNIIDVYKSLKDLESVVDVLDVEIVSKSGDPYSDSYLSIDEALSSDGRVVVCPINAVFEIKFPASDIKGTVK